MKCPNCKSDLYKVYSSRKETSENGNEETIQYRECKSCGYTGKTLKQVWVCEFEPVTL